MAKSTLKHSTLSSIYRTNNSLFPFEFGALTQLLVLIIELMPGHRGINSIIIYHITTLRLYLHCGKT